VAWRVHSADDALRQWVDANPPEMPVMGLQPDAAQTGAHRKDQQLQQESSFAMPCALCARLVGGEAAASGAGEQPAVFVSCCPLPSVKGRRLPLPVEEQCVAAWHLSASQ